jgi:hypothetical protein
MAARFERKERNNESRTVLFMFSLCGRLGERFQT